MFEGISSYQEGQKKEPEIVLDETILSPAEKKMAVNALSNLLPAEFKEVEFEKTLSLKEGFFAVASILDEESFSKDLINRGVVFENTRLKRRDVSTGKDDFRKIKSFLIQEMFDNNLPLAIDFFGKYLLDLPERRKWEWIERGMWVYDMDKNDSARYAEEDAYRETVSKYTFSKKNMQLREKTKKEISANLEKHNNYSNDLENEFSFMENDYHYKRLANEYENNKNNPYDFLERSAEIYKLTTDIVLKNFIKYGTENEINVLLQYVSSDNFSKYHLGIISKFFIDKNRKIFSEKILNEIESTGNNFEKIKRMIMLLAGIISTEETRNKLEEKLNNKSEKSENFKLAYNLITPISDKVAITNLQEFYQTKIKFEDYKINEQMNEKEVALLKKLVDKDDTILEMGCGTGRLTVEMAKSGYDISGYDYTERHAQITKEKLAENKIEAKVFQGDWHSNALADESFDAVYSLGRNILHDYSVISQVQLFREAARILKDGGKFIFDIPNREKGGYKELVEGYASEMKKRGIDNFRYGAIYDSPDGINFATRYAYSPEDISQLAQISGFEISEVRKEKLETGKDDENLYYVLTKKSKN